MDSPTYRELYPWSRISPKGSREGIRTNEYFELIDQEGSYRSAGVDGGITGMGFQVGIIDDPFKNRKEAESQTIRDTCWEWYTSTFYTRMDEEDSAIVIIMTRWHDDDLVGRLLDAAKTDPEADQWEVLSLPALMDDDAEDVAWNDPRKTGEALWPDKFPAQKLRSIRAVQGSYDWESLYQQRPYPPGGRKIKIEKFQYINKDDVPANVRWCFFADLAVSTKTTADFTVLGFLGYDASSGRVYIRDLQRFQKEWPDSKKIMLDTIVRHKPRLGGIEKAGQQQGFIDDLNREKKLVSLPLTLQHCPVDKDKLTRALPWIAKVEEEKFFLCNGAWVDDFVTECGKFTGQDDKHDDQIDFVSGGYELNVSTYGDLTGLLTKHAKELMRL